MPQLLEGRALTHPDERGGREYMTAWTDRLHSSPPLTSGHDQWPTSDGHYEETQRGDGYSVCVCDP